MSSWPWLCCGAQTVRKAGKEGLWDSGYPTRQSLGVQKHAQSEGVFLVCRGPGRCGLVRFLRTVIPEVGTWCGDCWLSARLDLKFHFSLN